MRIYIHAGGLSLDNGAYAPRTTFFNIAKAIGIEPYTGEFDGDDYIEIEDAQWPVVESLLKDSKMLYKVTGLHTTWQNVLTDNVRRHLRLPLAP